MRFGEFTWQFVFSTRTCFTDSKSGPAPTVGPAEASIEIRQRKAWLPVLREEMERPLFEAPTTPHLYGRQTKHPHPSRDDFSHLNHFKSNVRCIVTVVAEQNNSFSKVSGLLRNLPMSNQLSDPVTPQMLTRFAYSSAKTADLSQIREAQAIVTVLRSGPFDLSSSSVILSICGPQSPSAALTMSSNH